MIGHYGGDGWVQAGPNPGCIGPSGLFLAHFSMRDGKENTGEEVDEELICFRAKRTGDGDIGGDFGPYDASGPGEPAFCLLIIPA